ncbi:MAG TPA: AEC family transporter [Alphaproteobacteria bacterium]|nr:AEC family transporter [Alphaproteobacteria bacterium]
MQTSLAIVLPLFALILTGFVFVRARLLGTDGVKGIGAFVFNLAVPALLFRSMATGLPQDGAGLGVVYVYYLGAAIVFALTMLIGRIGFGLDLAQQALMAITATFSNAVLIGIPLVFAAFGREGQIAVLLITSLHSAIFVTIATVLVEIGRGAGAQPLAILRSVAANPLLLSVLAGAAWGLTGWELAAPLDTFTHLLAGAAAPAALFALGATLALFPVGGAAQDIATITVLKMVVHPALVWFLAHSVFGLARTETAVAVIIAALPSGVNPFILAQRYGIYVQRTASSVVVTTALAVVTAALLLAWFVPA